MDNPARLHTVILVSAAAVCMSVACSGGPPSTDSPSSDTAVTTAIETPLSQTDSTRDSVPHGDVDSSLQTLQVLDTKVDSLREELNRLTTMLRRDTTVLSSPLVPSASQTLADTSSAIDPTELARDAAQDARFLVVRIFWALVVLGIAYLTVRGITWIIDAIAERRAAQRLMFKRLIPVLRLAIWSFVIYFVIVGIFRIDQSGLLAAGAAAGVAIGFASQDVLKNIFGGLIIILDKPFQVGDKITVDGTYGEVVSIGLRATRIVTPDDNLVAVPNAKVVEGQVANANAGALDCQVVVNLFVPGWTDVSKAKSIAYSAAANSRYAYLDKPIVVNVKDEFKETFLTKLVVKAYVLDTRFEFAFASDITEAAKSEFHRLGMIPVMWHTKATVDADEHAAEWKHERA